MAIKILGNGIWAAFSYDELKNEICSNNEVWAVACDYEEIKYSSLSDARQSYEIGINARRISNGGLEKAIADYLLRTGSFSDDGEYGHESGYVIK